MKRLQPKKRIDGRAPIQLEFGDPEVPADQRVDTTPTIYTVTQIVRMSAKCLDQHVGVAWVEGEISNLSTPSSGHAYFSLKDEKSRLALVMFRPAVRRLRFALDDGQRLRCRGRLTIYEAQGRYQFVADHAEPTGLGALQVAFEQLRDKLAKEGLFATARKKRLPRTPKHIAVVTSASGAALRDILRVLDRRFPVAVTICPSLVQGSAAPQSLCEALIQADAIGADLIIAGRGGGSIEDLWAFNDEQVARTIAALSTPIISAVGHEIDTTIADLVADCRAPTPSAAAELAVPLFTEEVERLRILRGRLHATLSSHIQVQRLRLETTRARLGTPQHVVNRKRQALDELIFALRHTVESQHNEYRRRFGALERRLSAAVPAASVAKHRGQIRTLENRLMNAMARKLAAARAALGQSVSTLDALSPLGALARGYSITYDEQGHVVRRADALVKGASIHVHLHKGSLSCKVINLNPGSST